MEKLSDIILSLILLAKEGEYWDYKERYHECKAELLHDIICLANSLVKDSRYLIFGVDDLGNIVGIENDPNRKKQADLIDFLRSMKFAGDYRPEVELHTLHFSSHEIDVLIVRDSTNTPYYLLKDYTEKKISKDIKVYANYIYSRVCDSNTPMNRSSDLYVTEKLWRKRFGLDLTPLERVNVLLENIDDWDIDIGNRSHGFCKLAPEYQIVTTELSDCTEPCAYFYLDDTPCMGKLKIMYHSTILFEDNYWGFDGARLIVPEFEIGHMQTNGKQRWFYYYVFNSLGGRLLKLFTNGTFELSTRQIEHCFILFDEE